MRISVIVPVYNVEPYIRRCLDSLINQTYRNLEIILVDDGSTDRSGLICDEYALMDKRVQVIHKVNEGLVSSRQEGIQHATGEYATNVDSDDWIETDAYEFVVKQLETHYPDMLVLGYKKEYAEFTEEYRQLLEDGLYTYTQFWKAFNYCVETTDFFCQPIDMSLCNKVVKTELLKKHQLSCNRAIGKNEDDAVVFPCLMDADSVYVDSNCYYHYCVRRDSLLWKSHEEDYKLFLQLSKGLLAAYVDSRKKNEINKQFLVYKLYYHLMLDIPEKLITDQRCIMFPQIRAESNIIIYGKGAFASRLVNRLNKLKFCHIVANVDKLDIGQIKEISQEKYDYVVIAILNCSIVEKAIDSIMDVGAPKAKILRIEKENMKSIFLPEEVRAMLDVL